MARPSVRAFIECRTPPGTIPTRPGRAIWPTPSGKPGTAVPGLSQTVLGRGPRDASDNGISCVALGERFQRLGSKNRYESTMIWQLRRKDGLRALVEVGIFRKSEHEYGLFVEHGRRFGRALWV